MCSMTGAVSMTLTTGLEISVFVPAIVRHTAQSEGSCAGAAGFESSFVRGWFGACTEPQLVPPHEPDEAVGTW